MWSTIITVGLTVLGFFMDRAKDKSEMSKLMYEWLKKHRLTDHVKAFMDSEAQNSELDKKPFEETGAPPITHPVQGDQ